MTLLYYYRPIYQYLSIEKPVAPVASPPKAKKRKKKEYVIRPEGWAPEAEEITRTLFEDLFAAEAQSIADELEIAKVRKAKRYAEELDRQWREAEQRRISEKRVAARKAAIEARQAQAMQDYLAYEARKAHVLNRRKLQREERIVRWRERTMEALENLADWVDGMDQYL